MNKPRAFILLESLCALVVVTIGIYAFNSTFQQFIGKLRWQRQATDQAQVLWATAQHKQYKTGLSQLQMNDRVYRIQQQSHKIRVDQGVHHAEITW